MAECPRCGTDNDDLAASCVQCGTTLGAALPDADRRALEAAQAVAAAAVTAAPSPPKRTRRRAAPAPAAGSPSSGPGRRSRSGSSAAATFLPFIVAVSATAGLQWLLGSAIGADAHLNRFFRPDGGWIMAVVPTLIAFAFVWTLTDLAVKWWFGRLNERDLARPEIKQLPEIVGREPFGATVKRLYAGGRGTLGRPVGQRVVWVLHHLDVVDAQRAHELLRHQSDLDADRAAAGYRTAKLLIWAMPILGFIGTVLGIGLAVGGFSDFLATNVSIEEVDRVTAELGVVASGLSFAFDTTLLGLLAGLVTSVVSSGVQSREERTLTALDELSLEIVAHAVPGGDAGAGEPAPADGRLDETLERMDGTLERLLEQIDEFSRAVATGLEGLHAATTDLQGGVSGLGDRATHMDEANRALASSVSDLGERLTEFRQVQSELAPALNRLTGPLELRLTPASSEGGTEGSGDAPGGGLERGDSQPGAP